MAWYDTMGGGSITPFKELRRKFVTKYFLLAKLDKLRMEFHQFRQFDGESFSNAWERFQKLMRKCPSSMMKGGYKLQIFYNGLMADSKGIVNASARGSLKKKLVEDVHDLFQKIAENECSSSNERRMPIKKQAEFLKTDASTNLEAQLAALTHKMNMW